MTSGRDMPAPQVFDERIVTGVLGDNVKVARGISRHGSADIISEGEIEGIPAGGSEAYQMHRDSVLEKLFGEGNIEFCLPRAYQQGEADRLAPDDREIYLMDILEINEDMVYRGWQIGGDARHRILFGCG